MTEVPSTQPEGKTVNRIKSLKGVYSPPGDEYVSHLSLILGALAEEETIIKGIAPGKHVQRTADCLRALGVDIEKGDRQDTVIVKGTGAFSGGPGLTQPEQSIDCGDSVITFELMTGVLAGQKFNTTLTGSDRLNKHSISRVLNPLKVLGADFELPEEGSLPLEIRAGRLMGMSYQNPKGSAIVKAATLLAGLGSSIPVEFTEPLRTWDHTERLLKTFGANLNSKTSGGGHGEYSVRLEPGGILQGKEIIVPGDISAALYLIVAALLLPKSDLILKDVGLNPGRREIVKVLSRMGGKIELENRNMVGGESVCDIHIRHSKLKGIGISGKSVAWLMEDIPALVVAAAFAKGETYIKEIEDLRTMEIDYISALVKNLKVLDLDVGEYPDGLIFRGKTVHDGGEFDSFGDYRLALAFHVAALACHGESTITGYEVIDEYWPDFDSVIDALKV